LELPLPVTSRAFFPYRAACFPASSVTPLPKSRFTGRLNKNRILVRSQYYICGIYDKLAVIVTETEGITMTKKYRVTLTEEERALLKDILNKGKHSARKRKRAQALLLADEQMTDEVVAERAGMHRRGVEELRQRFVEEGFEATLEGKPHGHRARAIQGEDEARLIALIYSPVPEGCGHWTVRLLRDTWVTLEGETVSHETIRQTLKKTNLSPGKSGRGVFLRKGTRSL
jgi:transposase